MALIPKDDIVFKKIFGSKGSEEILKDLLEALLETEIKTVKLDLGTELLADFSEGKNSRIDVRAELGDGTQINVEMQSDVRGYSEKRCLQYWSRLYTNSIERGKKYNELMKTICIWIVDGEIYQEFQEFESTWKIKEDKLGIIGHFQDFEIHIIELKKFRETDIIKPKKKDFWLWFIDYTNKEMVKMACLDNKRIEEAKKQLEEITSDRALMYEIISRQMHEMDEAVAMDRVKEEGRAEGLTEGEKNKQLEIAKKMKEMQMDVDTIAKATGLAKEEIEKL